jgi:hypothetical protein
MPQLTQYDANTETTSGWTKNEGFYGAVTWLYYENMQEAEQFYEEKITNINPDFLKLRKSLDENQRRPGALLGMCDHDEWRLM